MTEKDMAIGRKREYVEINKKPKIWTKAFFLCVIIAAGCVTTIGVLFELEWYWIIALGACFGVIAGMASLMIDYPESIK